MKITNWTKQEIRETAHKVDVRLLYEKTEAQAMHIQLKPGETLKPHITPVDVFFYILDGTVDVRVGDETISVAKDNLVESPKDIVHCLSNSSNSTARVLVVKTPKPTQNARFL